VYVDVAMMKTKPLRTKIKHFLEYVVIFKNFAMTLVRQDWIQEQIKNSILYSRNACNQSPLHNLAVVQKRKTQNILQYDSGYFFTSIKCSLIC
jgi:hypothetical protein